MDDAQVAPPPTGEISEATDSVKAEKEADSEQRTSKPVEALPALEDGSGRQEVDRDTKKGKKSKAKPPRIIEDRAEAGPCLCEKGDSAAHKTVEVASRCWPGSNKPGGTARITKKFIGEEEVFGEMVQYTYYDVKYLLGGSEKGVKETFVTCTPVEIGARQSAPRSLFTVEASEPKRRRSKPASTRASPLSPTTENTLPKLPPPKLLNLKRTKVKPAGEGDVDLNVSKKPRTRDARAPSGKRESAKTGPAKENQGWRRPPEVAEAKPASSKARIAKENKGLRGQREPPIPQPKKEPVVQAISVQAIKDLSVAPAAETVPDAPLSKGRMEAFQAALGGLFHEDVMRLCNVKTGINAAMGAESFDDTEVDAAIGYLQAMNRVMVDEDLLYRI